MSRIIKIKVGDKEYEVPEDRTCETDLYTKCQFFNDRKWLECDLFKNDFLFLKNGHYLKCKACEKAVRRTIEKGKA